MNLNNETQNKPKQKKAKKNNMMQQSNDNQMYLLYQMNPYIISNSLLMNMYLNNNRQINDN